MEVEDSSSSTRRGSSRKDEGMLIRKGPWMAEEDEILMEYVGKYGPMAWSSIRAKGLLPRTGKSCRLRYVNKLKPNLKTGCKFSQEEERIVIDLQAQFGNKWARIATYLPGRTDNDVKNFWSTRQKRLARLLRAPLPSRLQKSHGRLPAVLTQHLTEYSPHDLNIPFAVGTSNGSCSNCSSTEQSDSTKMVDMPLTFSQNLGATLPLLELEYTGRKTCMLSDQLPLPDISLPLEDHDMIPGLGELSFHDQLRMHYDPDECLQAQEGSPYFGQESIEHSMKREDVNRAMQYKIDDLPTDIFDYFDPPPPSPHW